MYQHHLGGLVTSHIGDPTPRVSDCSSCVFLASSQVRLLLMVRGPHLEKHWSKHRALAGGLESSRPDSVTLNPSFSMIVAVRIVTN